jgi:DnaJ-class molecular chaperone
MRKYKTDLVVQFKEVQSDDKKQRQVLDKYKRNGNNLVFTATISLQQAINAEPVLVPTLDGRMIAAPVDSIVGPRSVITVPYEGMPIFYGR